MADETRDVLVESLAAALWVAAGDCEACVQVAFPGPCDDCAHVHDRQARAVLDRLAAPGSPVLLVARGDVQERVDERWSWKAPDGRQRRTVRSWDTPDGSHVEVTGPWTEVQG